MLKFTRDVVHDELGCRVAICRRNGNCDNRPDFNNESRYERRESVALARFQYGGDNRFTIAVRALIFYRLFRQIADAAENKTSSKSMALCLPTSHFNQGL